MRVMVIVKATEHSEAGTSSSDAARAAMERYNDALAKAGILLVGEVLHPSAAGRRVRLRAGQHQIDDGPFAPTAELVAGFWLWQVRSMEEATEWARRCPEPVPGLALELELRPVSEPDPFATDRTAES